MSCGISDSRKTGNCVTSSTPIYTGMDEFPLQLRVAMQLVLDRCYTSSTVIHTIIVHINNIM